MLKNSQQMITITVLQEGKMNKQFDVFVKMKMREMCKTIHDMTYTYIDPITNKPTDVPAKHYQDILKQPVEVLVEDQVKRQFLNIMFKQLKNLKDEEPQLFYQSLLLLDIGKAPDALTINEEIALKITADYMIDEENKPKKKNSPKFQISNQDYIHKFNEIKNDDSIMKELFDHIEKDNEGISFN